MKVRNILDSNSIMYTPQRFINGKSYDILLNFTNIVVEINGDYWHANHEKYLPDDEISYHNIGKIKASSVWERDRKKKENAEKYGYKVIYIWESEINRAKKNGNLDFFILNKIYENTKDKIN